MQLYNKDTTYDIWLYYLKKETPVADGPSNGNCARIPSTPGWKNNQPSS